MIMTSITIIGFKMPEEYNQLENFKMNNDMSEWTKFEDTQYISYRKTQYYTSTDIKG